MSRLDNRIQRDLQVIADRATPSPDAWDSILQGIADRAPDTETEIIMLTDNTLPTRRWPLLAAAAAVIALVVGAIIAVGTGSDDEPVPAVEPEVVPDEEGAAPDPEPDSDTVEIAPVDEGPTPLPGVLGALEAGRYSVESLGVPLTFSAPTPDDGFWRVQVNDPIAVTIGPDDAYVMMSRVGSFYGADESQDPTITGLGSIPADDIDAWIEANDVIVDESAATTVGGMPAEFRQVRAPAGAGDGAELCPDDQLPCLTMTSASADLQSVYDGITTALSTELPHLVWLVELDDFEPLIIWSHSATRDPDAWRAEVTPFIENIEIGEPSPAVEGGTARLPVELPFEGSELEPGRYTTDAFGVTATFDVPAVASAPWTLFANNQEAIVLGYGNTFVSIKRVGSFYDADEARDPSTRGLGSIAPNAIDQWIEVNGVNVIEQSELTIAGRSATYHRFTLPADAGDAACPGGTPPCLHVVSSSADQQGFNEFPTTFQTDLENSIWMVELGEFEPLGIAAYTADVEHDEWLDDLAMLLESLELGEPAPAVDGGTARLP